MVVIWPPSGKCSLIRIAEKPTAAPTSRTLSGLFIISTTFRKLCVSFRDKAQADDTAGYHGCIDC